MRNYGSLRFPGYSNEAASLQKGFTLTERAKLILKVDYFNLLNRSYLNYGVDTNLSDAAFGNSTVSANGTNRQGQATIRLEF